VPEVAGALICAVSADDPDAARRAAAATVGFYATVRTYVGMFSEHGYAARLPAIREAFVAGDGERLVEAVGPEMADAFSASGTPAQVRDRARVYEGLADRLWVTPPHHLQSPAQSRRWQAGILEAFDARG
jgi:alkanesulfonate monooxygenase SsuD/methylene tetrahydromethanopterin reductase-like flavin-dependent oxidoreductase (luciferase family)